MNRIDKIELEITSDCNALCPGCARTQHLDKITVQDFVLEDLKRILPTREYIDPVRYISNESSGKQGYEIALALSKLGVKTTLIAGPTSLNYSNDIKVMKSIDSQHNLQFKHPKYVVRTTAGPNRTIIELRMRKRGWIPFLNGPL